MTNMMLPLLKQNEKYATKHVAVPLGLPTAQVLIVTCLDHRIDPARVLGLELGDAPVIRNAGGRVTPAVINDVAFLAFLGSQLAGETDSLFEVAVIHHDQCGTGFLADPGFRRAAADATGTSETDLAASSVVDPAATVREDVERLLNSPSIPSTVSVSGYVYDMQSGRVAMEVDTRRAHPQQ